MSSRAAFRTAAVTLAVAIGVLGQALLADGAGAVTATKGQLTNGQLRLEGQAAPGQFVIAESTTSSAGARADLNGQFKIQATGFTAPDCKVTIRDGRTPTATVTLSGCTPSVIPVPAVPAPPTGSCVITPQPAATLTAGASSTVYFQTTGCDTTTNSGATPTPVQWKVVAGVLPTGMTGPNSQGTTAANIIGTPASVGPISSPCRPPTRSAPPIRRISPSPWCSAAKGRIAGRPASDRLTSAGKAPCRATEISYGRLNRCSTAPVTAP